MWRIPRDEYTYYKGGSGALTQKQDTAQEEAAAREWEAARQDERDQKQRDYEKAQKEEQQAKDTASWRNRAGSAYNSAQQYARDKLSGYGLSEGDSYGLWSKVMNTLSGNYSGLTDNEDYSTKLSNSVIDDIIGNTRSTVRSNFDRQLDQLLGKNYLDDTYADTIDDTYLDEILGSQYDTAKTDIENAKARGQLNQTAYDKALSELTGAKSKGRGTLEQLGLGVISNLRGDTEKYYKQAYDDASSFDFGDSFDANDTAGRVKTRATTGLGTLRDKISTAVGDTKYFDTNSIIGKATASGGVGTYVPNNGGSGSGTNSLYSLFEDQQRNKRNEGAF